MKKFLYLIQAAKGLPEIYQCIEARHYLLLSYQEKTADTTIYAPNTTWTQRRNLLYRYVRDNIREHDLNCDYYIFLDDDVLFHKTGLLNARVHDRALERLSMELYKGNAGKALMHKAQIAGFASLANTLNIGSFPVVTMRCWNFNAYTQRGRKGGMALADEIRKKGVENCDWILQSVDWFDPCCTAFSKQALFADTLLPYTEAYDAQSWWIANVILMLKANYYYPEQIIQNNQYTIINRARGECLKGGDGTKSRGNALGDAVHKAYRALCKEYGVDVINLSQGVEIKAKHLLWSRQMVLTSRWYKTQINLKIAYIIVAKLKISHANKLLISIFYGLLSAIARRIK